MGKFDTDQLSILSQTLNVCNCLGPQQLIAPSEFPYPFSGSRSITHHMNRALQGRQVLNIFGL